MIMILNLEGIVDNHYKHFRYYKIAKVYKWGLIMISNE
jgi:hypothetical protein